MWILFSICKMEIDNIFDKPDNLTSKPRNYLEIQIPHQPEYVDFGTNTMEIEDTPKIPKYRPIISQFKPQTQVKKCALPLSIMNSRIDKKCLEKDPKNCRNSSQFFNEAEKIIFHKHLPRKINKSEFYRGICMTPNMTKEYKIKQKRQRSVSPPVLEAHSNHFKTELHEPHKWFGSRLRRTSLYSRLIPLSKSSMPIKMKCKSKSPLMNPLLTFDLKNHKLSTLLLTHHKDEYVI
ncbi:unnamed protein product [Blepharisma stoltei]|uniref:Uncharacterized protein n=1 Tax=Blepharisma stoltei TaxID=1481888 RepID=A0AAU9ISU2_9CILI|nr:unnamed protein product [Blepharisma stoltei]